MSERKIYKYTLELTDKQVLSLPQGAKLLSVEEQGGKIVLYALVNPEEKIRAGFKIYVFETGHPLPEIIYSFDFLGTVKLQDGALMFHVFYY